MARDWTDDVVESLVAQGIPAAGTLDDTHLSDGLRVVFGRPMLMGRIYHLDGVYTISWLDKWGRPQVRNASTVVALSALVAGAVSR